MKKTWEQTIKDKVTTVTKLPWITNIFSAYVMVFSDDSWLFLDEDLLWLRPGSSDRIEMVWPRGTVFSEISPHLVK